MEFSIKTHSTSSAFSALPLRDSSKTTPFVHFEHLRQLTTFDSSSYTRGFPTCRYAQFTIAQWRLSTYEENCIMDRSMPIWKKKVFNGEQLYSNRLSEWMNDAPHVWNLSTVHSRTGLCKTNLKTNETNLNHLKHSPWPHSGRLCAEQSREFCLNTKKKSTTWEFSRKNTCSQTMQPSQFHTHAQFFVRKSSTHVLRDGAYFAHFYTIYNNGFFAKIALRWEMLNND